MIKSHVSTRKRPEMWAGCGLVQGIHIIADVDSVELTISDETGNAMVISLDRLETEILWKELRAASREIKR